MNFLPKSLKVFVNLLILVLFLFSSATCDYLTLFPIYMLIIIAFSNRTKDTFKIVFGLCFLSILVSVYLFLSQLSVLSLNDFLMPTISLLSIVAAYLMLLYRYHNQSNVTQIHKNKLSDGKQIQTLQQLSAAVAHDFNNVMSIVMGNAELLKVSISETKSSKLFIDNILKGLQRGTNVTQSLLSFAQKQFLQPVKIDLNDLILNFLTDINLPLEDKNKIHFTPTKDLWMAKIDPTFFKECLLHLIQNALQASSTNINIEISNIVDNMLEKPKRFLLILVSDDGLGITEQNIKLIYHPFFTTRKATSAGGLGLSVVYGFCHQSGGYIEQQSTVKKGTTFKLLLPATMSKNSKA